MKKWTKTIIIYKIQENVETKNSIDINLVVSSKNLHINNLVYNFDTFSKNQIWKLKYNKSIINESELLKINLFTWFIQVSI